MNRPILRTSLCAALLGVAAVAPAATPPDAAATPATGTTAAAPATQTKNPVLPPPETPKIKRILKAMGKASTSGHPDLFGEFAGMQRLFEGDYAGALKYFKIGARYADKLSQYSIGMMYFNGRGVKQDPVTACAWLTLAAERKFKKFVKDRDFVCDALTPAQHDQATAVLDKLLPEYGDKVAKRRMRLALAQDRMALTGSHVGYDFGVLVMGVANNKYAKAFREGKTGCRGTALYLGGVAVPTGCSIYSPALLNPETYFAARDAQFNGTVTVGPLQNVKAPASSTNATQRDDKATPASASSADH